MRSAPECQANGFANCRAVGELDGDDDQERDYTHDDPRRRLGVDGAGNLTYPAGSARAKSV
jgi:hypothetical protein